MAFINAIMPVIVGTELFESFLPLDLMMTIVTDDDDYDDDDGDSSSKNFITL